ncbi:hypothetical protein [Amycolatopsis japonica]
MATRGWRLERTVSTKDTTGQNIDITVGLSRDQHGNLKGLIGIGDGPTAVLGTDIAAELIENIRQTAATALANEQERP